MCPSFGTFSIACFLALSITQIQARCYDPSPAFQLPEHRTYNNSKLLSDALQRVAGVLEVLIRRPIFDISSFSVEVTTSKETLWELHHTARERYVDRPGVVKVTGNSVYRMASVTKCFTVSSTVHLQNSGMTYRVDTCHHSTAHRWKPKPRRSN